MALMGLKTRWHWQSAVVTAACLTFMFINLGHEAAVASQSLDQEQRKPLTLDGTEVRNFHSQTVGVDYLLYVSLPRDYDKQSESYPIVFVLDADYCFPIVHQIARLLADHDELRPLILVGITYPGVAQEKYGPLLKTGRTRDYTPTHVASGGYGEQFQKQSGGADRFLNFIQKELIPDLDKEFRVKPDRSIVGYSYGGLLATYGLLTRPTLFQRYIIVSPSLWYDNHAMLRLEKKSILAAKDLNARAFFAVGGLETRSHGEKEMVGDLNTFVSILRSKNCPGLRTQVFIAGDETHHSVFPAAAMRGIRFIFDPGSSTPVAK
jgi:predicted alpha/beta superfamily hydrolase